MNLPTVDWLCRVLEAKPPDENSNRELGSISIDSRNIRPGQMFWAIPAKRDGHDFIRDAIANGAGYAVANMQWATRNSDLLHRLIVVKDTAKALETAGKSWREELKCPIVGITGSNGKTTTKEFAVSMLKTRYKTVGTQGNLNNELGVPMTILGIPRDTDLVVLEFGAAKPGDIAYLCNIAQPTHGLVTSIAPAHLQGFGSLKNVAQTKGELYDAVAENGIAFVPVADEHCVSESSAVRQRIGYGFSEKPTRWPDPYIAGQNLTFDKYANGHFVVSDISFDVPLPGKPAALAALAAITIASSFDISFTNCATAISKTPVTSGRASILNLSKITVLDDSYNANPASMRAALETLMMIYGRRRVAILGDMLELGDFSPIEHRMIGEAAAHTGAEVLLFVGEQMRTAYEAAQACGAQAFHFLDTSALEKRIGKYVHEGDAVLVKGSRSMRMENIVSALTAAFR